MSTAAGSSGSPCCPPCRPAMLPQLAACDPQALGLIFELLDDESRYEQVFNGCLQSLCCACAQVGNALNCLAWRRRAAAAVSRSWRSTVRSEPRFWPAVVLRGSEAAVSTADWMLEGRALDGGTAADEQDRALVAWETDARAATLSKAALISARTERVRLERFNDQVGASACQAAQAERG